MWSNEHRVDIHLDESFTQGRYQLGYPDYRVHQRFYVRGRTATITVKQTSHGKRVNHLPRLVMTDGRYCVCDITPDFDFDTACPDREQYAEWFSAYRANDNFDAFGEHLFDPNAVQSRFWMSDGYRGPHSFIFIGDIIGQDVEEYSTHFTLMSKRWRVGLQRHRSTNLVREFLRLLGGLGDKCSRSGKSDRREELFGRIFIQHACREVVDQRMVVIRKRRRRLPFSPRSPADQRG